MKTKKLTSTEKLAFYKENGYWFGTTPKATLSVNINRVVFVEEEKKSLNELMAEKFEERISNGGMTFGEQIELERNNKLKKNL